MLIVKFYIYKNRCKNSTLNFGNVKKEICNRMQMEKFIAITNGNFHQFDKKWNICKGLFE